MTPPCPKCGGKLKSGKMRTVGSQIRRYRSCACGYSEKAYFQPETLLRIVVLQRTNSTANGATDESTADRIRT